MRAILPIVFFLTVSLSAQVPRRHVIEPPGSSLGLPFSPGIRSGDFLYLSGSIGRDSSGRMEAGIGAQTRQTMANLGVILKAAGMDFHDVVSANVYLIDSSDYAGFESVYSQYFTSGPPARTVVETDLALPRALVEISMIAARPGLSVKRIEPAGWPKPSSAKSWGVMAGDTLFLSGLLGRNPATSEPLVHDAAGQVGQALRNVGTLLSEAGMDYGAVVTSRVYLEDARDFQAMNEVYRTFFPRLPPARATVRSRHRSARYSVIIQCTAVRDPSRKVVLASGARPSSSPLSASVVAGGRQFLSGMVGRGKSGFAAGDVRAQTRQTLKNLESTLKAAGLDFEDVVESMVYLADVRHFSIMNEVYKEMFPGAPPARTTAGTQLMSPDALVEIMMTAVARDR